MYCVLFLYTVLCGVYCTDQLRMQYGVDTVPLHTVLSDVYCTDHLRLQYSVDTLKFVLFLYIQQVYRVSLRASLVAGDEYPWQ